MDFRDLMEYQNMLQQKIKNEQKIDNKIELISIINQLTAGPKNLVQKEQILIEAATRGFDEKETLELLKKLIDEKIIFESSPGYIKKR